jgi:hypothetical protein
VRVFVRETGSLHSLSVHAFRRFPSACVSELCVTHHAPPFRCAADLFSALFIGAAQRSHKPVNHISQFTDKAA